MSGTDEADELLEKLNKNNPVLIFEESESGVRLVTSYLRFVLAMDELNNDLVVNMSASFNNFLSCFKDEEIILPDRFEDDWLKSGWCYECMQCRDGPWITHKPMEGKDDGELVFSFTLKPRPCTSFMECFDGDNCYE